jgi:sulfofructose kinase
MTRPSVLVVGYCAYDVIVPVAGLPPVDSKLQVERIITGGGGPGATAAVALSRLGCEVRLLTVLTADEGGLVQRRELEEAGVDLEGCPVHPGPGGRAVILVHPDDGKRTILWSRGGLPALAPPADPDAILAGRGMLYLDGHENFAALPLAAAARRLGLPVVLDAGSVREGTRDIVPLCTDVLAAAAFGPDFAGAADPRGVLAAILATGVERAAVTFGSGGLVACAAGGEPFVVPAFAVDAVDSTGAGDVFHAGYAAARLQGAGFEDALVHGAAVAALKCRDYGGRRALPDGAEARAFAAGAARRAVAPVLAGLPVRLS